ncbi:MAG: Cna B-type domain-containing protein [Peptococcaceae bacterium]|nr:Cna B-type domain-containing protein [Peptococcaceae bacterium]
MNAEYRTRNMRHQLIAAIMVLCMLLTIFPTGAFANENSDSVGTTATSSTVVDTDTKDEYSRVLGAADSTQYDGRVWVDKTVSDKSITFTKENGGEAFGVEKSDAEDFLVTYSALANTSGLQIVPEDKVSDTIFVLDFSMTMNRYMNNTNPSLAGVSTVDGAFLEDTRIYTMLNAMDETIETLRKANSENRVGIVTFYGDAKVLLPLTKLGEVGAVVGPTGDTVDNKTVNYTTPNKYFSILGYKGHDRNNNKSWVQCNIPENPTINELSDYTSMQSGVYEALDMFREERSDGTLKDRQANVIMITDGESNTLAQAVEGKNWYEELSTDNDRNWNVTNFTNNVFATILTASYLKEYVGKMYVDGCEIYTVGLLKGQDMTNMQSLLDPGRYLDEESEQPQIIKDVLNLWNQYNSDSDQYPTIGGIEFSPARDPNVENEILPSTLDYADAFYNAENASQLANAFQEITSNIIVSEPKPPTEIDEDDPTESGYITFTDPLGKYMEVKDVKCIIFDDQKFEKSTKELLDDRKKTRYTFSGTVDNPASSSGVASVADILIDVTQEDAGHQTVTIQIPASVVPLRSNTVYLKSGDSTPIQLRTNEHYPMRIVYSVGLQEQVTQEWLEGNDRKYLTKNKVTDATGNSVVNFYANLFDGDNIADGTEKTLGNATATFTADTSNPFYYAQKGSVLYVDKDGTKVPAAGSFSSGTTYYVKHDYYYKVGDQLKHEETWLGRSDLTEDNVEQDNGQLILKEDMLKQADLASARTEKTNAVENTADYSYYAKALDETEQVAKGSFLAYLGNNGKLSLKLSEPEEPLTISVEKVWQDENNKDGIRPGSVTVELIKNGTATGKKLTLNEGNNWKGTFTVENPDENVTYTVMETDVPENYTSTVKDNQTTGFIIINTYTPMETQEKRISVEKVWQDENNKDGIRPGSVTVELIKDGTATGETLTLNDENDWKDTFIIKDYDEDAKYTVQEQPVPDGYKCVVIGDAENGFTITNTHSPKPDPVPDDPDPGEDDDPPDTPDDLNTVDHYLYIEGYPEDYRTGEESWDESVWPVKPQGNITRAEVATIFYRLLKDEVREEIETDVNNFPDVNEGDWFNVTVSSLANMGAVGGYEDGTFRPNEPITRAELSVMAVRFYNTFDAEYEEGTFLDIDGDEWYATAIAAAKELGIISGYPDGSMRPEANITRAETCAIVNRVINRHPHEEHLGDVEDMRTWPDNLPGAWYYADMQEATNGHYYEWIDIDGSKFEEWIEVDKDYDWTKR